MTRNKLLYWIPTSLFVLAMLAGGIGDLVQAPALLESLTHLGYPAYVATLLGIWKLLGVAALLLPGTPRLKEWAYAGFAFDLTGAVFSHLAAGDGIGESIPPLVLLAVGAMSWRMAPATRSLNSNAT